MGMNAIKLSRDAPKISIRIVGNTDDLTPILLRLARAGSGVEFAEYIPTKVADQAVEFTFDELLFSQAFGRYDARLTLDNVDRLKFQIQYVSNITIFVGGA